MADYIFIRKSRNALSSFIHILLNILLGVGSILLTALSNSWIIGFILVLLSKWRVFAVQPRYLLLNIRSNLVDFIVGFSFIMLAFVAGGEINFVHLALAALYTLWLIIIKPISSENGNLLQALIAVFLGTTASVLLFSNTNSIILVILEFFIGYGASRHVLAQNGDHELAVTTLASGLVFSEIAWLAHFWIITYNFNIFNSSVIIPQLAIILTVITYVYCRINHSLTKHDGKLVSKEIAAPIIFGITIITILLIFFSKPAFNLY